MGEGVLTIKDVSVSFDGFQALEDVCMEVATGEVCCVIGTNGAGKTTLFNAVMGQVRPNKGHVYYKGQDITGFSPHAVVRLGIGRSFQCINIFPRLTAFQNVQAAVISHRRKSYSFFGRQSGLFADETHGILAEVGLDHVADSVSGLLSYGYQKQLELGIALAFKPELLVLDEPTSGLSPSDSRHAMDLVSKVAGERGTTLLIVEHDMAIVFAVATHIVVLHQGRVICDGSPEEVRANEEVQKCYLGERV